jgi:hypothetical protein
LRIRRTPNLNQSPPPIPVRDDRSLPLAASPQHNAARVQEQLPSNVEPSRPQQNRPTKSARIYRHRSHVINRRLQQVRIVPTRRPHRNHRSHRRQSRHPRRIPRKGEVNMSRIRNGLSSESGEAEQRNRKHSGCANRSNHGNLSLENGNCRRLTAYKSRTYPRGGSQNTSASLDAHRALSAH